MIIENLFLRASAYRVSEYHYRVFMLSLIYLSIALALNIIKYVFELFAYMSI